MANIPTCNARILNGFAVLFQSGAFNSRRPAEDQALPTRLVVARFLIILATWYSWRDRPLFIAPDR